MKINCGEKIKYYRQLNNMSQAELGDRLGVKHGTVSSWEINRTEPKIGHIEHMCRIFDCNKSDLIPAAQNILPDYYSEEEKLIIEKYRAADAQTRDMVKRLMHYAEAINNEKK